MSYITQSKIVEDQHVQLRVTACAASESIPDPAFWAQQHMWALSAEPGWGAAYASALAAGVDDPGADESVISDGMILAAVQHLTGGDNE